MGTCVIGNVTVPVDFDPWYSFELTLNPRGAAVPPTTHAPRAAPIPPSQLKIAEYFGGIGSVSHALPSFQPVAYFDCDSCAAFAYADQFGDIPQFADIQTIIQSPSPFVEAASDADIAFIGAPCNAHSVLNCFRHEDSESARLPIEALKLFIATGTKIGLFEFVPEFMAAQNGRLFSDFVKNKC